MTAIRFIANPTQQAFIMSRAEADLFCCRQGEGKSAALCWSGYHYTSENPGAVGVLIRDTWTNLQRTTQKEFFGWFPPGVMGAYHGERKCFTWAPEQMGKGELYFIGLDDPRDAHKVQSMAIDYVLIDEPSPVDMGSGGGVSEEVFDILIGRMRNPRMRWSAVKMAQNNPPEDHWTYRRFVDPGEPPHDDPLPPEQEAGFRVWQTRNPENLRNLKVGYYETLRRQWRHRPDMVARLVDGQYWRNIEGDAVTPEYDDFVHTALGLVPVPGRPLTLMWDGGHRPTCVVSQVTPAGNWLILDAIQLLAAGTYQLLEEEVAPLLRHKYRNFEWWHTGDPSLEYTDQSDTRQSPLRVIKKVLGGEWRPGPVAFEAGREPLRACLRVLGRVKVDRENADIVRQALRGKWHFRRTNSGVISERPVKDQWSDPGDCMRYGAAVLFPLGAVSARHRPRMPVRHHLPKPWCRTG